MPLVIRAVQDFRLKPDAAVLQRAERVIKVCINRAGVDNPPGQRVQLGFLFEVVDAKAYLNALQHIGHHLGVAAVRDALVEGVEIVVVEGQAHRQPLDDKGGQFVAGAAPLAFLCNL